MIPDASRVTPMGATAVLDLGNSETCATLTLGGGSRLQAAGPVTLTVAGAGQTYELQAGSISADLTLAGANVPLNKTTAGAVTFAGRAA